MPFFSTSKMSRSPTMYFGASVTSIISLAAQAKSFLGMFLNEPHSTHRYYGEILESNRDRLFLEQHSPFPYYAAGLAVSRVEDFFRAKELPLRLRPFKHHLLMLFRLALGPGEHPPLKAPGADDYAKKLCAVLWDESKALAQFRDCVVQLQTRLQSFEGERHLADRLRAFTVHLMPSGKPRPHGIATYWNIEREFGFVRMDSGKDVFVHSTAIRETVHKYLRVGDKVEFDIIQSDRGPQARDLRILPKP